MRALLVDIGNTSTAVGLSRGRTIVRRRHLSGRRTAIDEIESVLRDVVRGAALDAAIVSSVVPSRKPRWTKAMRRMLGRPPLDVTHRLRMNIGIDYPRPATIGADRIANACAALDRFGAPVLVADFGTALTFDVVDARGDYVGGVIAPGLPLMRDYLADRTALLPRLSLHGPVPGIGRSTEGAMRIGASVGYRGIVREIVDHVQQALGAQEIHLCATGGYARWALRGLELPFVFDPDLTLRGLSLLCELNTQAGKEGVSS